MIAPLLAAFLALPSSAAAPRLAVVIDDFGLNYKTTPPDADWLKAPWPFTAAVMPESPRTSACARLVKASTQELIIHFPFDPFLSLDLPEDKASESDVKKVEDLLETAFKQIPGSKGLNNHRSLKATRNRPLMKAFMERYKARGGYFLDSKVSERTVAYEEARAAGIPAARNLIFLEEPNHYNDKPFCAKMLRFAASRAKRDGSAVVIGHHYYRGTKDCLFEEVPKLQAEGFEFVKASALVR